MVPCARAIKRECACATSTEGGSAGSLVSGDGRNYDGITAKFGRPAAAGRSPGVSRPRWAAHRMMRARRTFFAPGDARAAPQPGSTGLRRSAPVCNIPDPEEAATAAVSKSLPPRRPGDAPAPLPHPLAGPQAKARGLDPRGGTHRPNTAATAPALRFRGSAEQRTGATIHPET